MSARRSALTVFLACVVLGVGLCAIWGFVSSLGWRVGLTAILLISAFVAARVFGLANWERAQRRRAVSLMILLSGSLVTKGLGALLFQVPAISDLLVAEFESGGNWWYLIPAALLSGTATDNLILICVGLVALGWVIVTLKPDQSDQTPTDTAQPTEDDTFEPETLASEVDDRAPKLGALRDVVRPVLEKAATFWSGSHVATFDSDFPPQIPTWVGRKSEIQAVMDDPGQSHVGGMISV